MLVFQTGDYTPTEASVIGALLRELSISVRELAQNKEEDLRNIGHAGGQNHCQGISPTKGSCALRDHSKKMLPHQLLSVKYLGL